MYVLPRKILVALVGLKSHDITLLWSYGEGHWRVWQRWGRQEKTGGGPSGERKDDLFSGFSRCCLKKNDFNGACSKTHKK